MSIDLILRLSLMIIGALLGFEFSVTAAKWAPLARIPISQGFYPLIIPLVGAAAGFTLAPYVTLVPYRRLRNRLRFVPARVIFMGVVGAVVGLIMAALLALPLSLLPGILGQVLPITVAIMLGALGATTTVMRDRDILSFLGLFVARDTLGRKRNLVLLDTSVIIDGRVADVAQTGFISGILVVPRFVLDELQHIADSPDVLRRNRGRRGLDILNRMQKNNHVPLEISEMDVPDVREVDGKLIKLARELACPILTNDYNLNRVAEIQRVKVLNINELANAVKSVVLPGETLRLEIIQEGKEAGQGVGYLDDGTMVVVEDGRHRMNEVVDIIVTRVLQTVAGRMIFGQLLDER